MSSSISKRQIARNERVLQELMETVPGNSKCADCGTPNPGWASWNLGIFLCLRCASIHRKLGTHISKVKSLSMDTWTTDQVESMRTKGNDASNNLYNPHRVKLNPPNDMNDFDRAVERFIRQKYEHKSLMDSGASDPSRIIRDDDTRYPPSMLAAEDPLPHLPVQKTGRKFGLGGIRSTSNLLPKRFRAAKEISEAQPSFLTNNDDKDYYSKANKPSRILGSKIRQGEDGFDAKLAQLREMGFRDSRQNSVVLRNASGDLDRAIEQLVKAAERAGSPAPSGGPDQGLKVEKRVVAAPATNNPFEMPQRSVTAPLPQTDTTSTASFNPFLQQQNYASQQQPSLDQSFQYMSLSQGTPSTRSDMQDVYLQSGQMPRSAPTHLYTPPHSIQSYENGNLLSIETAQRSQVQQFGPTNPFGAAQISSQTPQDTSYNPTTGNAQYQMPQQSVFVQPSNIAPQQTSNPFMGQMQPAVSNANPYGQQALQTQYTGQTAMYQQARSQPGMPLAQFQQQQQQQNRPDKASILALYDQPRMHQQMQHQMQAQVQQQSQQQIQPQVQQQSQHQMQPQVQQQSQQQMQQHIQPQALTMQPMPMYVAREQPQQQQLLLQNVPANGYTVNAQGLHQPMQQVAHNPFGV